MKIYSVEELRHMVTWRDNEEGYCFDCKTYVRYDSEKDGWSSCKCFSTGD